MLSDITVPGVIAIGILTIVAILIIVICLMDHGHRIERLQWKEDLDDAEAEQDRLQSIIDYLKDEKRRRWFFMINVPNTGVKVFRLVPGLDADGVPGVLPDGAVITWSLVPLNNDGTQPPTMSVSEDQMEATVDFGPGKSNDQWRIVAEGRVEADETFMPHAETDGYNILPGFAQSFTLVEVG